MGDDYLSSDEDNYYSDSDGDVESDDSDVPSRGPSFKVITRESLLAAQRDDLQRVMELLSVREHHARTLLIYYRWDVDKLSEVYVEKGIEGLFARAGLTLDEHQQSQLPLSLKVTCEICMDDVSGSVATRMDCGHCFCNDCWTEHFIVKINDGQSKRISCMAHKCNAICDEGIVRNLVSKRHPDLAEKFDRFLLESFIEDNKMVKWCPSVPHCGNAIQAEGDEVCEVECSCGMQFCFKCLSEAHSPCSCLMWKLWCKKCQDESENVNWITVNTKSCPKCGKPVEKNGGCNLVTCVCGQYFCWLCGGATGQSHTWRSIAGHSCGRYTEDERHKVEQAKRNLNRYTHYYNRYKAHIDSLKLESKLKETLGQRVSAFEEANLLEHINFNWVTNGSYRLFRSRRVLSYSYPFAYHMFGGELFKNEMTKEQRELRQHLFEDQQQRLEENVERLSKYIEQRFNQCHVDEVMEIRQQVINLSTIVDNLCKSMYECIETDLLGAVQLGIHSIAPYRSNGIERASEL